MNRSNICRASLVFLLGLGLSACSQSSLRISPDFGSALNQDVAAQIADPDAHYEGTPSPGSNGARVGLAQKRYQTNTVIPPSTLSASGNSAGNGSNGNGASAGAGVGASSGGT
jgi:hypothetical protein